MNSIALQGSLLKIEGINTPVFVVSKDFFNKQGAVIGCPVYKESLEGPLHIYISTEVLNGYVQCENLRFLDLRVRSYYVMGMVGMEDIINITDAVQSIFDYL